MTGCIVTMCVVGAAAARWCEVQPVGRPQTGVSRPRPSASRQHSSHLLHTSPAMQPSPMRTIGVCTYRRFLSLCRPTLARAQRSVARFALKRTLHFSRIRGRVVCRRRARGASRNSSVVVPVHCVAWVVFRSRCDAVTVFQGCDQNELVMSHVQSQNGIHNHG
jgi:hypothetical protein